MPVETKRLIAKTYLDMARASAIDRITVKELVQACGISRQTFYYHFQDLLEVNEWLMQQAVQQALSESLKAQTPEQALRCFVRMAVDGRELVQKLLHSQRREQAERMFLDGLQTYFREMLHRFAPELSVRYSDAEVALRFISYGTAGLILDLGEERQPDAEQLCRQIGRIMLELGFGTQHEL